jgi:hypothetical protein
MFAIGWVHRQYGVDPRAVTSSANPELATMLLNASGHPGDATAGGEGWVLILASLAIVANHQVHPIRNASRVEGDTRGSGMAMDICHRFLSNAQEGALHLVWQIVNLGIQASPDIEL